MPNHSQCLSLLSSAMSQYKKYKCARMQRHMMLLMADEYSALTYHSKALQVTNSHFYYIRRRCFAVLHLRRLEAKASQGMLCR